VGERSRAEASEELRVVNGGGSRPDLNGSELEEAKAVLALAAAGIQRERAAADGHYTRGRSAVTVTATLFLAVQAAFMANVGRESEDKVLLSSGERGDILIFAIASAVFLVAAIAMLIAWLDRPRKMVVVGGKTLRDAWLDQYGQHTDVAVLDLLALRATQEEDEWAASNENRYRALKFVGAACAIAVLLTLVELTLLYLSLT
jgi:hypothetical protein